MPFHKPVGDGASLLTFAMCADDNLKYLILRLAEHESRVEYCSTLLVSQPMGRRLAEYLLVPASLSPTFAKARSTCVSCPLMSGFFGQGGRMPSTPRLLGKLPSAYMHLEWKRAPQRTHARSQDFRSGLRDLYGWSSRSMPRSSHETGQVSYSLSTRGEVGCQAATPLCSSVLQVL